MDIVESLRQAAAPKHGPLGPRFPANDKLMTDAAATITALRKRLAEVEGAATTHQRTVDALREATEALERLAELTPVRANARDAHGLHLTVKAIAEAALSRIKETTDGPVG